MNKLILEITYSIKGEIFHATKHLELEKIDEYEVKFFARESILKLDRHAVLMKVRVYKVEFSYIILP